MIGPEYADDERREAEDAERREAEDAADAANDPQGILRQYADAYLRKKDLDERLGDAKRELETMALEVETHMLKEGIESTRVNGVTIYISNPYSCKVTHDAPDDAKKTVIDAARKAATIKAAAALKTDLELPEYVSDAINIKGLATMCKEIEAEGEKYDARLDEFFKIGQHPKVNARLSK